MFNIFSIMIFVVGILFPNWWGFCVEKNNKDKEPPISIAAPEKLQNSLTNIESEKGQKGKIILSFSNPVTFKAFSLSDPARLVVDFPNTHYAIHQPSGGFDFSEMGVVGVRHGIQDGYNLRMVFDLQHSEKYSVDAQKDNNGKKFQVSITFESPITTSSSSEKPATVSQPVIQHPVIKADKTFVDKTKEDDEDEIDKPQIQNQSKKNSIVPVSLPPHQKFIVVIDAGHGGKDPGAAGPQGTMEKDVTLSIAKDLATLVNNEPEMKAVLTRSNDIYIGLRHRLMIARKAKGSVFVAIHADAYDDNSATGASVYALSLHGSSSEAALWLSQKENYSELDGIDLDALESGDLQVRSVLIDLSQTANISASLHLGRDLLSQLGKMTDLHHSCVEQAPFMVLKSPDIPSVLVETGFITNATEENRLKTENYQQKLAKALLLGLKAYYEQYEKNEMRCVRPHMQ